MKIKLLPIGIAIVTLAIHGLSQSVVVTGKKVTYTRPKPFMEFKKTFTINHPQVRAATPALSRKIESAISYEKAIPLNIEEEMDEYQWLEDADFEVVYNKDGALAVNLSIEGSAAYPSGSTKTVVVDTGTGSRVRPADVFVNLKGLAAMVRREQKKEIAASIKELRKENEANPESLFADANFKTANLDWFSISDKGVTFVYDYGFPHVIQALQPDGQFTFTWRQLRPYLKRGGLLSRIAH
jgi:hypothetical protein